MLAVLWALFFRPVGFDYRSKIASPLWRSTWDWGLFIGGAVPPLIFGVAFGNLLQGVPFQFDANLVSTYTGSFWALLNPFALLTGVVASTMITFHGAIYLTHRSEGAIQERARRAATMLGRVMLGAFTLAGIWLWLGVPGYAITSAVDPGGLPDPLAKTVAREAGAWLTNYGRYPWMIAAPVVAYAAALAALAFARSGRTLSAFAASSLTIVGIIGTVGVSMFPFIMPSSIDPASSLTVWDSVSSRMTLAIMFFATLVFMPIIIVYTGWAYRVMAGKVTVEFVRAHDHTAY